MSQEAWLFSPSHLSSPVVGIAAEVRGEYVRMQLLYTCRNGMVKALDQREMVLRLNSLSAGHVRKPWASFKSTSPLYSSIGYKVRGTKIGNV